MVKQMKSSEDKLISSVARDERLGEVLSNGLKEMGTDGCPGIEDIALLVDGGAAVSGEKKEEMMKHLASCDNCYEIFLLTTDLQEEKAGTGTKREKRKVFLFKPLALAASFLIVIFSIYIFYKSGEIPKTTGQLARIPEMKKERQVPLPTEGKKPASKADVREKDKIKKKAAPPPAPKGYTEKGKDIEDAVTPVEIPRKDYRRGSEPKKIEKSGEVSKMARRRETADKKSLDEAGDMEALRTRSPGVKRKTAQLPRSQKLETPPPIVKEEEKEEERLYKQKQEQVVVGGVKKVKKMRTKSPGRNGAILWSRVDRLIRKSRNYKAHIPGRELQELFRETIQLTEKMNYAFASPGKSAAESFAFGKKNNYNRRFEPLITVITGRDGTHLLPDIDYFLSKSEPGSIYYQFFNLARSGWCDPGGLRHGAAGNIRQWEELYPRLSGIFREIAAQTLKHLKQRRR